MAVDDDGMQCSDHPFQTTSPSGGICAFCLQEKLGKLVSSSSSSFFIASSSSSSPSLRSDIHSSSIPTTSATITTASSSTTSNVVSLGNNAASRYHHFHNHQDFGGYHHRRARIPFLLTQKKKKKSAAVSSSSSISTSFPSSETRTTVLKRSKSTATPRSTRHFSSDYTQDFSPRRRGFWSFPHLSNTHNKKTDKQTLKQGPSSTCTSTAPESVAAAPPTGPSDLAAVVVVDETDDSPNSSGSNAGSFSRKVSRSRSVGCGSRSFSGDLFERISTGFGDCTLRRVESQREGSKHRHSTSRAGGDSIGEKVRCGGIFGGLIITSSTSSSYWVGEGKPNGSGPLVQGRSRSWGWAFASPMRAFTKPTTTIRDGKRELGDTSTSKSKNGTTPDLAAIPSLLAVSL